jgi:hypothetical protein
MAIEFHYETGNIQRLGCQHPQISVYGTSDFLISGARGEVIERIEVDLDISSDDHENMQSFWKHGRFRSFRVSGCSPGLVLPNQVIIRLCLARAGASQISTNRGRKKHLGGEKYLSEQPYLLKPIVVVPGTTLTGLYAGWVSEILFSEPGQQLTWMMAG